MSVRSRRWTVEVASDDERWEYQGFPVECVWLHYWQRAGSAGGGLESVELWGKPYGEPIASLLSWEARPDWLTQLVQEHQP